MSRGDPNEGMEVDDPNIILIRVENVNNLTNDGMSFEKRIFGFPWRVKVYRRDENDIGLIIHCEKSRESAVWDCEVEGEVKLINQIDSSSSVCKDFVSHFLMFCCNNKVVKSEQFDDVIGNANFVIDGYILIEAKIYVTGGNGDRFRKKFQIDFFSPSKFSDAILSVEGKKLHVSKQILANASAYFEILFFGDFKKPLENEVDIKDVSFEDLLTVLELIYDTGHALDASNVESVLMVADLYQIPKVTIAAEKELMSISKCFSLKTAHILFLSDKYSLYELQAVCLSHLFRPVYECEVINSEAYNQFSHELKNDIKEWISHSGEDNFEEIETMQDNLRKRNIERIEKMMPKSDLLSPSRFSDVVLLVEGEKIYASKQILAYASSYFENLFYGDLENVDKKEFTIEEVSSKEFLVALEMIYNTRQMVDDHHEVFLLKIADRFKITSITDRVEESLIDHNSLPFPLELRVADQFKLEGLIGKCLKLIRNYRQVIELTRSESYTHYSNELKIRLFEKMTKLWEKENTRNDQTMED